MSIIGAHWHCVDGASVRNKVPCRLQTSKAMLHSRRRDAYYWRPHPTLIPISATRARGLRGPPSRDRGLLEEVQRQAEAEGSHTHNHARVKEFLE